MTLPRLLAITPPEGAVGGAVVDVWIDADVGQSEVAVMLRTPGAAPGEVWTRTRTLAERCAREGRALWMALDAGHITEVDPGWPLQGVLLRGDPDAPALTHARRELPDGWNLARSVHEGAGALLPAPRFSTFAPVFPPRTSQPGRPKTAVGVDALRRFCTTVDEPVFALGGVSAETAAPCLAAGAWGLATIRGFFGPPRTVIHDAEALVHHTRLAHGISPHS